MKQLYFSDRLDVLKDLYGKYPNGFIDLIYIDPLFSLKKDYNILSEDININDAKAQPEIEIHGFRRDIASAKELARKGKGGRLEFQEWIVEVLLHGIHNPKRSADGGWNGYITFIRNGNEKEIILIEVKSGKANLDMLRKFIHIVNNTERDMGVFVCFAEQASKSMKNEAKPAGEYPNYKFDKIQIITIEDLLVGKEIRISGGVDPTTFKKVVKDVRPENSLKPEESYKTSFLRREFAICDIWKMQLS